MRIVSRWQRLCSGRPRLSPDSLQFRLTAGVTLVAVCGVGSVAGLTSWRMQQLLVTTRKEYLIETAARVAQDAAIYQEMMPMPEALQRSLDNRTTSNLVLWVKASDQITAQSDVLRTIPWQRDGLTRSLLALSAETAWPDIQQISDRYFLLCSGPLVIAGQPQGTLFVAEDITRDQTSLFAVVRILTIVSGLGSILMAIALAVYIRRSLSPLHRISQLAGAISAHDLGQTQLQVDQAPLEVKDLVQAFNHMLTRLAIAWTQQRQFVSDASHELRTPLAVVQGYVQSTLRRGDNLTAPQREGLEIAATEVDHTIQLLQDLLDLARADSGHLRLHWEHLDVHDLVCALVSAHPRFRDRVDIKSGNAPSAALQVPTDGDRLRQVLVHLLDNALNYSAADSPITVELTRREQQVQIQVRDRGGGIPAACLPYLFEPFYRVDENRSRLTGGTGLGLSIVKILVTRLGGTVQVESGVGVGSTFTITLPMTTSGLATFQHS